MVYRITNSYQVASISDQQF